MSGTAYKGGLAAGGPAFADKAKLHMRRPTPDSDALASSDDEHVPVTRPAPTNPYPAGRRPSSGWLQDIQPNRKFSLPSVSFAGSNPTTPSFESPQQTRPNTSAFPWNTSSFTAVPGSATRLKEVVPSPTSANPSVDRPLPSPTNIEGDDGIGFLLNQQHPIRKSVRSQSYSVGQADLENTAVGQFSTRLRSSLRHRPSKPSLLGDGIAQLAQLREDEFDEVESSNGSEQGIRLPAGYWEREQKQALLKQAAVQNARSPYRPSASPSGQRRKQSMPRSNTDFAIDELEHDETGMDTPKLSLTRRFSEHAAGMAPGDQLGRRHSFATYTSNSPALQLSTLPGHDEVDEDLVSPHAQPESPTNQEPFDPSSYFAGFGPASRAINASAISAAHPAPIVPQTGAAPTNNPYAVPTVMGRPGRRLYVVVFKCSRAEIYYTYDNTGLEIRRGDLVIVEGDRGCDLGQVSHANVSMDEAKRFKAEASDEHYRWLVMFSQYSLAGTSNDSGMLGALARANGFPNNLNRSTLTNPGTGQEQDVKPKMIKRLAQQHEIAALRDKEGQEAKAKRVGAIKAAEHKFPMEILDAEYQADHNKLTYFYYAETYVNFNDLVVDLFKQYKVRIWMSAVNPASVVNPAGSNQIQPPSAIGPGAILHNRSPNASAAVGPGFGSASYRSNNRQHGRSNAPRGGGYDESYYPFANQLQGFSSQSQYAMNQWAAAPPAPDMYGRFPGYPSAGYPSATASGTPMNNYGTWYPPATYSSSPAFNNASSNASYRGGNQATAANYSATAATAGQVTSSTASKTGSTGSAGTNTATGNGNPNGNGNGSNTGNYGAYSSGPAYGYGNEFSYNNSYVATSTAGASYDPAMVAAALQNLNFGNFTN